MEEWRELVKELSSLSSEREETIIDSLQSFIYPIEGLTHKDVNSLFTIFLTTPTLHTPTLITKWSRLLHSLVMIQRLAPPTELATSLFELLLKLISKLSNPSESLYALSSLVRHARITAKAAESMIIRSGSSNNTIMDLVFINKDVLVKRAALDCVVSICTYIDVSPLILNGLIEPLLFLLNGSIVAMATTQDVLQLKLQVSILRTLHQMLTRMSSLQPLPVLPSLLATLKVAMTTGLPGHFIPRTMLPLTPHPDVVSINSGYQATSVAGPRQNRTRRKPRPSQQPSPAPSDHTHSPLTTSSKVEVHYKVIKTVSSGSESELSDSDVASGNHKEVNVKLRLRALSCLSVIFQSLERQHAFSYGLAFLPDTPRSPKDPPTLLTVLCKDHSHRCRSIAISVLIAILDNSKPFLAVANDQHVGSHPYTPYSSLLGGVVSELHRSIFLAISAETHPASLTQIIKCLSVLISNVPYHQLTGQYINRIFSSIQPLATKQDTDVAVGCLTCYGALISLSAPHRDVGAWLREGPTSDWPWLVQHCIQLIENQSTNTSLKMEAVQVLTAVVKFFFPLIKTTWSRLSQVYFDYLAEQTEPLQLHALKFLEEIGRTLATRIEQEDNQDEFVGQVVSYWERLLQGPLVYWLQSGHTHPLPCSQSCSVLATIGSNVVKSLKTPTRVLMLTLILGLSNDENASIKSNAVRALGIFSQYNSLNDDSTLLMDISDSLTKGLHLKEMVAVRVQASWAVANLTDSLLYISDNDILSLLYPSLAQSVGGAMSDVEKVKVNAVRAAGNLLHILTDEIYGGCGSHVTIMCSQLTNSINVGIMKSRWNTCYACYNAFSNGNFVRLCSKEMLPMIDELCKAVISCKNFKVRTNAALALGGPSSYPTPHILESIWITILKAISSSECQQDFTEYRQTSALRIQLCQVLCGLILQMEHSNIYIKYPPSSEAIRILEQPIKEILGKSEESKGSLILIKALSKLKEFQLEHSTEQSLSLLIKSLDVNSEQSTDDACNDM